jgi:hypothetical protein
VQEHGTLAGMKRTWCKKYIMTALYSTGKAVISVRIGIITLWWMAQE